MPEVVEQNIIRKTPEAPKAREKLSDEQMGNLLSAIGNHEAKAITLILMRSEAIYDMRSLHREVLNSQGNNKGWIMNKAVPFGYCSQSLAPIGLVAMEIINPDLSTYGYAITKDGKELGIPLAGLLLDFSEKYNVSLHLLFGATISRSKLKTIQTKEGEYIEFKTRAPSTTLKILYELLTSPNLPIRDVDITKGIGSINMSAVNNHLARLSKLSLIQRDTVEIRKPFSRYKLATVIPQGELPIHRNDSTLTKSVFDVLKNCPGQYLTAEDIYNFFPKERKEKWKNKNDLRRHISAVLFFLAKHKYADIERFHQSKQSEINITDEQRIVLTELLEIIDRFQAQDEEILEKGRSLAGEIISNPQKVSNLLKRAKEASGNANQSSLDETQEHILSIIRSKPNGVTNKEIGKLLEKEYDKRLGKGWIMHLTFLLRKQGRIDVKKEGIVNTFFPHNEA